MKLAAGINLERFELAVKGSNDGIWDWDIEANQVFFSPRWLTMLGYEGNDLPQTFDTWERLIHPEDSARVKEALTSYLEARSPRYEVELRLRTKEGGYRWIFVRGVAVRDGRGAPMRMAGSHTDIHDWKAAQEELRRKNEALERLASDRARFIATLSHELRTPLTAVKEGLDLVRDGSLGTLNDSQSESLELAARNADRLQRLINNVLVFSKIQAGKFEPRPAVFALGQLAREVALDLQPLAQVKNIELVFRGDDDLTAVIADRDQLHQVLTNLAANAIKFTQKGRVTVAVDRSDRGVRASVSDTGPGIAAEDLEVVFKEFEQGGATGGYRVPGGSGLGLAISRSIIEAHNSRIVVSSKPGVGTKFQFTLPAAAPS